jgi:hypothetical protein
VEEWIWKKLVSDSKTAYKQKRASFSRGSYFKTFDLLGGLCDPAGIRTQDPNIKSVMLYQLSYGIILFNLFRCCQRFRLKWCKYTPILYCLQVYFKIIFK